MYLLEGLDFYEVPEKTTHHGLLTCTLESEGKRLDLGRSFQPKTASTLTPNKEQRSWHQQLARGLSKEGTQDHKSGLLSGCSSGAIAMV